MKYIIGSAIIGGGIAAALLGAGIGHADTTDDQFLAALRSAGIHDASVAHVIDAGHFVCVKLDNGSTVADVETDVMKSSNLPAYHSGFFVGASIKLYCPQYTPKVIGA